jgi:hypothetical protein
MLTFCLFLLLPSFSLLSWLHIFKVKIYFVILFFLEIDCNQSYFMKLIFVEHDIAIFSLDYIVQTCFMKLFFLLKFGWEQHVANMCLWKLIWRVISR